MNKKKIKRKSLVSIKWASLGTIVPKIVSPFITIILANILVPEDFGIVAIAITIIGFSNIIQGLGLSEYIIKDQNLNDLKLSVAFWSNVFISIVIYLLVFSMTNIIAHIYHNDQIINILPVMSLLIIVNSLGIVQNAILQKQMMFKKIFFIQVLPVVILLAVTLPLALSGFGVWSLIIGELVKNSLTTVSYWIFSSWFPKLTFSFNVFVQLFNFGKWVIIEKVEEYLVGSLEILLIGAFIDLETAGLYAIAKYIITVIYSTLNGPIGTVAYPMFSELQGSRSELKSGFFSITKRISLFNFPIMFGIASISSVAIPIFFPDKWEQLPLILTIIVMGEGIHRNIWAQREIFKVLNKPDVYPKAILPNLLFGAVFYYLGAERGLIAFCIVKVLNDYLYTIIQLFVTSEILQFKISDFLKLLYRPIIASIFMALVVLGIIYIFNLFMVPINIFVIIMIITIAILIYISSFYFLDKESLFLFLNNVKVIFGFKAKVS